MLQALEVVGRESEIDSVHGFLEAVPGGPVALLIEGDAGIGKTTLWREGVAGARERGLQVLTSRPVEAEIALPFTVLGDLLGEVPDTALRRLPDPQREALEVALLRAEAKREGLQRRAGRKSGAVFRIAVLRPCRHRRRDRGDDGHPERRRRP